MNNHIADVIKVMLGVADDPATPEGVQDWINTLVVHLQDSDVPDPRFVKGGPIPETLGMMADEYAVVRAERLRIDKESKAVKERETEIYNCVMSTLDESTDTGASGTTYRVQRIEKDQPRVTDWPTLHAHIQATGSFELLGRSVNKKAVMEQIESGEIPGVAVEPVPTLSFTKVDS